MEWQEEFDKFSRPGNFINERFFNWEATPEAIKAFIQKTITEARIESLEELKIDIPDYFHENAKEILKACNERIDLRIEELRSAS